MSPTYLKIVSSQYDVEGARQSIESPGVLLQHIAETTDSFSLYIKGRLYWDEIMFYPDSEY